MNCKGVLKQLNDHLDGTLDPGLAEDLKSHLEDCEDCRVIVDTTRKTIEIICDSEPAELPPGVRERLRRALATKLNRPS